MQNVKGCMLAVVVSLTCSAVFAVTPTAQLETSTPNLEGPLGINQIAPIMLPTAPTQNQANAAASGATSTTTVQTTTPNSTSSTGTTVTTTVTSPATTAAPTPPSNSNFTPPEQ